MSRVRPFSGVSEMVVKVVVVKVVVVKVVVRR